VFKCLIVKILIIVLLLKIMMIMDFDNFYFSVFSRLFSAFPLAPAAHLQTLRVIPMCRDTPADPSRHTNVQRHTCRPFASFPCVATHLRTLRVIPVCRDTPEDPSRHVSVTRHNCGPFASYHCATTHRLKIARLWSYNLN
jgi:hypothetical protein